MTFPICRNVLVNTRTSQPMESEVLLDGGHQLDQKFARISTTMAVGIQRSYVLSGAKGEPSVSLQKMLNALADVQI